MRPPAAAPAHVPACARPPCRARSCRRAPHAPPPSASPGTASPPPPPAKPRGRRSALNASEQDWQSTSTVSAFHCWVEFTELDTGVLGGELPLGPDGGSIAPVLPGVDVALPRRLIAHPVRQVTTEGTQLDLGHILPGAGRGRVGDFVPGGEALGLLGRERLVERGRGVGVE